MFPKSAGPRGFLFTHDHMVFLPLLFARFGDNLVNSDSETPQSPASRFSTMRGSCSLPRLQTAIFDSQALKDLKSEGKIQWLWPFSMEILKVRGKLRLVGTPALAPAFPSWPFSHPKEVRLFQGLEGGGVLLVLTQNAKNQTMQDHWWPKSKKLDEMAAPLQMPNINPQPQRRFSTVRWAVGRIWRLADLPPVQPRSASL